MEYQENEKRTSTTTTTTTCGGSTSTRAHAREDTVLKKLAITEIETIKEIYFEILGRQMPKCIAAQLQHDLTDQGTPAIYYQYALQETAAAPMPSWRYVLAIVARLKRQQVPEEDLLWWF